MTPRVSVVIPHFNRSGLLRLAIESVIRDSGSDDIEVVVVDDGSRDDEWDAVSGYSSATVQVIQRRDGAKGPSRCRNLGVAASRGDYVIFLDSDDIMASWCVDRRLKFATDAPRADFWAFPVLLFADSPGDSDVLWNRIDDGRDNVARFASGDSPWHTSSVLWKKTALESIGGFNEAVLYGDDSDLHLRAVVSGLNYREYAKALPDIFIRRSNTPRITNSLTPALVESRRTRLREGERFLNNSNQSADILRLWETQYFIEAEFLLFNLDRAHEAIDNVLGDWETAFSPSRSLLVRVRSYFAIGLATRRRAYLLLRLARRAAMLVLPAAFFSQSGDIAPPTASTATMTGVRTLLDHG